MYDSLCIEFKRCILNKYYTKYRDCKLDSRPTPTETKDSTTEQEHQHYFLP